MTGGFVTRNCPTHNIPMKLPEATFMKLGLWVACPRCRRRMSAQILQDQNYGYACGPCGLVIQLFKLLPLYSDL